MLLAVAPANTLWGRIKETKNRSKTYLRHVSLGVAEDSVFACSFSCLRRATGVIHCIFLCFLPHIIVISRIQTGQHSNTYIHNIIDSVHLQYNRWKPFSSTSFEVYFTSSSGQSISEFQCCSLLLQLMLRGVVSRKQRIIQKHIFGMCH